MDKESRQNPEPEKNRGAAELEKVVKAFGSRPRGIIKPMGWKPPRKRKSVLGKIWKTITGGSDQGSPDPAGPHPWRGGRETLEKVRHYLSGGMIDIEKLEAICPDPEPILWHLAQKERNDFIRERAIALLDEYTSEMTTDQAAYLASLVLKVPDSPHIDDEGMSAARALGRMGDAGLDEIARLLDNKSPNVRHHALWGLWWTEREKAPPAKMNALILRGLRDSHRHVLWRAASFAGPFAEWDGDVRRALLDLLQSSHSDIQWQTLLSLERLRHLEPADISTLWDALPTLKEFHQGKVLEIFAKHEVEIDRVIPSIQGGMERVRHDYADFWSYLLAVMPIADRAKHLAPLVADVWMDISTKHGKIYIYGPNEFSCTCTSVLNRMAPDSIPYIKRALDHPVIGDDARRLLEWMKSQGYDV